MTALALVPSWSRLFLMANDDRKEEENVTGILKAFLEGQRRDEKTRHEEVKTIKSASDVNTQKLFQGMQQLAIDIGKKVDGLEIKFSKELIKTNERIDDIALIARGAHDRLDNQESGKVAKHTVKNTIYELGEESPTGSWKISKETLEQYDLAKEVGTWRWIKSNATKILVTMISTLATTYIVLKLFKEAGIHLL